MTEAPGMEANKAFFTNRPADMFNQIFYNYGHKCGLDNTKKNGL